jgi:antitoxin HigA-1
MDERDGTRMKHPVHPGAFVKFEVIEPLDLSVTDAARVLGVTRAALSAVLNERSSLSPEMAMRIEQAFGVSMDTLLRMQLSFDIAQARHRLSDLGVRRYVAGPGLA